MRRVLVGFALLLSACGGSSTPVAPTPPANATVSGGWSGTFEYSTTSGRQTPIAFAMDLTQAGSTVNGTYATSAFSGTVSGATTPTNFSGSFTFNAQTLNGSACTGTMAVSGSAGASTMSWTSPAVTANCTNTPTAITIAVQRR